MTDVQRHAELCYQECTLIKAILGIMYSGDWFAFVKEALNLRAANIAYKNMSEFIKHADAAAEGGKDKDIDEHFRSGVLFGDGINSLILSMLPSKVMTVSSCLLSTSNDELTLSKTILSSSSCTSSDTQATAPPPSRHSTQSADGKTRPTRSPSRLSGLTKKA